MKKSRVKPKARKRAPSAPTGSSGGGGGIKGGKLVFVFAILVGFVFSSILSFNPFAHHEDKFKWEAPVLGDTEEENEERCSY